MLRSAPQVFSRGARLEAWATSPDLIPPLRRQAPLARRHAELGVEAADEVGEVLEADIERDVGDRRAARDQAPRRVAQPRAQQPLMRRDAGRRLEAAQEVIGAEARV